MDTVRQRPRRLVALGLGLATIAGVAVAGTALAGSPAAEQARAQTEAAVATAKEKVQDAAQGVGGFTQQATP